MAVIRIPSIDVNLPIYHGTSEGVLQVAAGHYLGSSLPIGGESTHAILTGHRGTSLRQTLYGSGPPGGGGYLLYPGSGRHPGI